MSEKNWYLRTQDETFGPETREQLVSWAELGRIQPGQEVSDDNEIWQRVEDVPFLDMRFSVDLGDGNPRGPFNRKAVEALIASGRLPPTATMVETRAPFPVEEPASAVAPETLAPEQHGTAAVSAEAAPVVEPSQPHVDAESSPRQNQDESVLIPSAPVEKVIEKIVEVPVEKVVEKTVTVVDETRVKELEGLLEEERRHTHDLQSRMDAASKAASDRDIEARARDEATAHRISDLEAKLVVAEERGEAAAREAEELRTKLADAQAKGAAATASVTALEPRLADTERHLAASRQETSAAQAETADVRRQLAEIQQQLATAQQGLAEARQENVTAAQDLALARKDLATAQQQLADLRTTAETAAKDALNCEQKLREQVHALEDELRRLPQTASEVADIQAAMYGMLSKEAEELKQLIDAEKAESDEFRRRQQERADRLAERRRDILRRTGTNIEEMTRKALVERPEDPRTTQLRKELDEVRRVAERKALDQESRIRELADQLRMRDIEGRRLEASGQDLTQLRQQTQALAERLQTRERELMELRKENEAMRVAQATSQQALITRLAQLEAPVLSTVASASANQSREAKGVKLPNWMRLKG